MTTEQQELYLRSLRFPDKFSLYDVLLTSQLIKKGLFPWGSSNRVYVPKPGVKDKMRPITIPPFLDRVVQKSICMILESINEPYFEKLNRFFGFRPNKGTHDAIVAFKTYYTQGMKNAIEGDVEAAYDTVNREKLLKILSKKVHDKKLLDLIQERLCYEYVEITPEGKSKRVRPTVGIPQGGIDSPYLFNIYMNELDEYIEYELKQELFKKNKLIDSRNREAIRRRNFRRGLQRKMKPIKAELKRLKEENLPKNSEKVLPLRQKLFNLIKEVRLNRHKERAMSSVVPNRRPINIFYIRYADDWILLTTGTTEIANFIKSRISKFLIEKLDLKLSESKTVITDITKEKAKFLGFELKISSRGRLFRESTGYSKYRKTSLHRNTPGLVWAAPDKQRLINRLQMKGFCTRAGFPRELPWLSCIEPQIIIQRFNSVLLGLANFYLGYIRNNSHLHRWLYILKYSCLKTFAQKYKTTIRGIYKRFGTRMHSKSNQTIEVKVRINTKTEVFEKKFKLYSYKDLVKILRKDFRRQKATLQRYYDVEKGEKLGEYPYKDGSLSRVTNEDYLEKIS
jgi:retron-type reverse transcriptase